MTPAQARAELARRELTRRQAEPEDNENLLQKVARYGLKDPLAGILTMVKEFGNIPHKLINAIPAQPDIDWGEAVGVKNPNMMDKIIQTGSQYAPSLMIPGANIGRVASGLSRILPKAGPALAEGISQAIPQAAFGATQNESPIKGAAEGAAAGLASPYLSKIIEAMRPTNALRGALTPAQLNKNLEITKGTETSLGRVLENPSMMRLFENVLPHVIGSGAEKSMLRNAETIRDMMKFPPRPENFGESIRNSLQDAAKEVQAEKTANFKRVNELAEQHGVTTPRHNMRSTAENILKESESDPHLSELMDAKDRTFLESLASEKHKGNYSLKNTDILKGKIGEHAREAAANRQQPKVAIYNKLRDALTKDSEEAIENSGSKELRHEHANAMRHYKEEVVPFEDPDIVKFTRKGGDPDLILSHFFKGGENDRSILSHKLLQKLEPESKNMVRSWYFSKALDDEGVLNPIKFKALYNKLAKNPNQMRALYPEPELRQSLKDYADLIHKNAESYSLMFNPKTGARNTEGMIKGLGMKLGQLGGVGIAHSLLTPLIAGGTLGKAATKLLTSEKVRESLIKSMLKNEPMIGARGKKAIGIVGQTGLADQGQGNDSLIKQLIQGMYSY